MSAGFCYTPYLCDKDITCFMTMVVTHRRCLLKANLVCVVVCITSTVWATPNDDACECEEAYLTQNFENNFALLLL